MTPYEYLTKLGATELAVTCPAGTMDVGGKQLHWPANPHAKIEQRADRFVVTFANPLTLAVGLGIRVPLSFEILPDATYAVGSRFGMTQRQKLVFQDFPE